jgi:hypothetical protein
MNSTKGTWLYKAARSKLDSAGTAVLANRGFLARSAYRGVGVWIANVRDVQVGDDLHFYYSGKRGVYGIGLFEIVDREGHATPALFGDVVPETALYTVENDSFIRNVDTNGEYKLDPVVGKFTGWLLRRKGDPMPYPAKKFPGLATLVRSD